MERRGSPIFVTEIDYTLG